MLMISSLLSSFVMLSFLSDIYTEVPIGNCFTCANPYLKDKWATTGLPVLPTDMSFSHKCIYPDENDVYKPCTGNCMEMMFPLDGMQHVVRGCYNSFFPLSIMQNTYEEIVVAKDSKSCSGVVIANATVVISSQTSLFTSKQGIRAISVCDDSKRADGAVMACNTLLYLRDENSTMDSRCAAPSSTLTCRKCLRIGNNGECERGTKTTCNSGTACMKAEGKFGDVKYTIRDCQALSPLMGTKSEDNCFDLTADANLPFLPEVNIGGSLSGKMCVCKDPECNPASTLQYRVLAIVLGFTILLPFV